MSILLPFHVLRVHTALKQFTPYEMCDSFLLIYMTFIKNKISQGRSFKINMRFKSLAHKMASCGMKLQMQFKLMELFNQ